MPYRKDGFFAGEYYHIFNRVSEGSLLFPEKYDYLLFLDLIRDTAPDYPLDMICYCLMPTHFHFLIKPLQDGFSVSRFLSALLNSHVRRLQSRDEGKVKIRFFAGRFKHVRVESTEQLIHLMRYIHQNPVKAGLVRRVSDWPYSDYREKIDPGVPWTPGSDLLSPAEYEKFVRDLSAQPPDGFPKYILD